MSSTAISMSLHDYEAYLARHPDAHVELIHGRMVPKVTSEEHGKIAGWLLYQLIAYLQEHPEIQGHWSVEASYRPPGDAANERRPAVSFRRTDQTVSQASHHAGMPDFAVEIKSPGNTYEQLREKARFYLAHGATLVWLIYPEPRFVEVYPKDETSAVYKEGQTLAGGDVLPGFELAVSALFDL